MNKLLLSLALVLIFSINMSAQSQNSQTDIQTLTQRVDSLEHELSYLRLSYELYTLNSDISKLSNEVETRSIGVQLNFYRKNFSSRLVSSYRQYYESCIEQKRSYSELAETKKDYFILRMMTYNFTESERRTLIACFNLIDKAFSLWEQQLDMLKISIDMYSDGVRVSR